MRAMSQQHAPDIEQDLAIIDAFRGFEELGQQPPERLTPLFHAPQRHYFVELEDARFVAVIVGGNIDAVQAAGVMTDAIHPLLCYTLEDDRVIRVRWCDTGEDAVFEALV